jgi:plasmid stabilization system protein ParE
MGSYQFTPQAVDDLFEIWSYIAGDDLEAAHRVEEAIYAGCGAAADSPLAGSIREDLTAPGAVLACATVPELLDCVRTGDKADPSPSNHPRGTKYS